MSGISRAFVFATFLAIGILLIWHYWPQTPKLLEENTVAGEADAPVNPADNDAEDGSKVVTTTGDGVDVSKNDMDAYVDRMVSEIAERFAGKADDPSAWITLYDFRRYLLLSFPDDGRDLFELILRTAFSDQADAAINTIGAVDSYHRWYANNQLMLAKLPSVAREQLLWQKREELLAEQAAELWSPHRLNQPRRQFDDRITALRYSENISLDDKVFILQTAIADMKDNSGSIAAEKRQIANPNTQSSLFLNMPSVQKDLAGMDGTERVDALADLRASFGFSEQDIEKLAMQDEERDARWERGLAYMNDRNTLADTLEGEELDSAIEALRDSYFPDESEMIRREEAINFFRYNRPRVYGIN